MPEWTQTGQTEDGFAINRYFIDHPEMVLGRQEPVSTAHGMDYTVNPVSYTHLDVYKRQPLLLSVVPLTKNSKP